MTITVTIPAPCEWLNSNQRLHPQQKARRSRTWRDAAKAAAQGLPPFACPVRIIAHVQKPIRNRFDPGNWYPTAKACVDGIVDAQLLADDDYRHVEGPDMRRGEPGPAALILTITPL